MKSWQLMTLVGVIGGLVGCSTEASFKVNQQLTAPYVTDADNQNNDDKALEKRLNSILSDQLPQSKIKVVVDRFNVLLVGQVLSNGDKLQAETICKKWPGTKQVFNYLDVSDKPTLDTSSSISSDAMARIKSQYDVNSDNLKVITVDNIVYIMGTNVGNLTALDTAIQGIYTIPKVRKVVNLEQKGNSDYVVN